jgi:epoxyqueuosine reductase
MSAADAVTDEVLAMARACGFELAGIADARPSDYAAAIRAWVAEGRHGSMTWLAEDLEVRIDPGRLLRGAQSVICVADRYARPKREGVNAAWPPRGRIARYARGEDYHEWIRKRLRAFARRLRERFPTEEFRIACDLLPILERELAARAGIGAVGKHTLLLRPGEGSYLLLGEVVTTLALTSSPASRPGRSVDPCGTCARCIDACPTAAITPYSVDASRCISFTTIEHRGTIDEQFHEPTGDWLFGCDICQEVCPHNLPSRRRATLVVDDQYAERFSDLDLLEVLGWGQADRLAATIRSALRRARLDMLKRNAIICLANALRTRPDDAIWERIAAIAQDPAEDDLVRETARVVLRRRVQMPE